MMLLDSPNNNNNNNTDGTGTILMGQKLDLIELQSHKYSGELECYEGKVREEDILLDPTQVNNENVACVTSVDENMPDSSKTQLKTDAVGKIKQFHPEMKRSISICLDGIPILDSCEESNPTSYTYQEDGQKERVKSQECSTEAKGNSDSLVKLSPVSEELAIGSAKNGGMQIPSEFLRVPVSPSASDLVEEQFAVKIYQNTTIDQHHTAT